MAHHNMNNMQWNHNQNPLPRSQIGSDLPSPIRVRSRNPVDSPLNGLNPNYMPMNMNTTVPNYNDHSNQPQPIQP
eukprot:UN12421